MSGKLYVIGVGPGDPELLTLKAVRILKEMPCICVPKGREEGSSLALTIIKKIVDVDSKEIIEAYFPMRKKRLSEHNCELDTKWSETVETVYSILNKGSDMAFVTIGDPSIYSTFFYLYDKLIELNPGLAVEIIPGISSINASASRAKISLGLADEKIAVLPAAYIDDLKGIIGSFDTVVLMKVHKAFDKILDALDEMNLTDKALYISKAWTDGERIFRNIGEVRKEDLNYFSMVIIKK